MKRVLALLVTLLLVAMLAVPALAEGEKVVKIGFAMPTVGDTSWVVLRDSLLEEAEAYIEDHPGVKVEMTVVVADNDATVQSSQILDLISSGVDCVFCAPVDSTAIWTSITDCHDAGIPIFAVNRAFTPGAEDPEDGTFGWKVEDGAYHVVKSVIEKMLENGYAAEDVRMLHIFGDLRDENALLFRRGAERAMGEFGITAAAEIDSEWNEETLLTRLGPVLEANPDINLIFCPSDGLINATIASFDREGKWLPFGDPNHIYIGDTGSFALGLKYLREGYIDMCGICPYGSMCKAAIEQAVIAVEGGEPESVYVDADFCTPDLYTQFEEEGKLWGLLYE